MIFGQHLVWDYLLCFMGQSGSSWTGCHAISFLCILGQNFHFGNEAVVAPDSDRKTFTQHTAVEYGLIVPGFLVPVHKLFTGNNKALGPVPVFTDWLKLRDRSFNDLTAALTKRIAQAGVIGPGENCVCQHPRPHREED